MSNRRLAAVLLVVGLAASSLSACGTGGSDKVASKTWARKVCTETTSWVKKLSAAAPKSSSIGDDPKKGKAALVKYLDTALTSTRRYLDRVDDAGVPDVKDGSAVAKEFRAALGTVETTFSKGKTRAEKLPVDDKAEFSKEAKALSESISKSENGVGTGFKNLQKKHPEAAKQLQKDFGQKACTS